MPLPPVPMPRRFVGRSVVVTGAGTGFGAEIAVRAAQEGARRRRRALPQLGGRRRGDRRAGPRRGRRGGAAAGRHRRVGPGGGDGRRGVRGSSGQVDVLVNNVGDVAREQMSWRDITEESIDHVLGVDIKGTMACIHEFGKRMLDQGHGSIVNIGSTVIVRGSARAPQYAAAKYGLLGATKSYAHAFAPTVRVNIFAPGFIETEATLGRKDWQGGPRRPAAVDDADGPHPRPGRARRHRAVPGHRRRQPHHRRLHGGRRRLQHGRRLSNRPSRPPAGRGPRPDRPGGRQGRAARPPRRPRRRRRERRPGLGVPAGPRRPGRHGPGPVEGVDLGHPADPQQRAPAPDDQPAGRRSRPASWRPRPEAMFPGAGGMPVLRDGVVVAGVAASGATVSPFLPAGRARRRWSAPTASRPTPRTC